MSDQGKLRGKRRSEESEGGGRIPYAGIDDLRMLRIWRECVYELINTEILLHCGQISRAGIDDPGMLRIWRESMRGIGEKSIGLFNEPRGEEPRDEKSRDEEPGKRSRRTRNRGTRSKGTRSRGARDQGIGAKGRGAVGREAGHAEFKKQGRGLGFQRPKAQRRRKVWGGGVYMVILVI